jgi:hypothetical protein
LSVVSWDLFLAARGGDVKGGYPGFEGSLFSALPPERLDPQPTTRTTTKDEDDLGIEMNKEQRPQAGCSPIFLE